MQTATFKAIEGSYKISDIQVVGAVGAGEEFGQVVNEDGSWGDTYYYLTEDEAFVETGWYKDMSGDVAVSDDDALPIGQALFFTSCSDLEFTYAGEVISGKPAISVPTGFSMVGNPIPVNVAIGEIEVTGALGAGEEFGQVVNDDGSWGDTYYYLTEDEAFVETGWYKDMSGDVAVSEEEVLTPGNSLFFTSANDLILTFPAAL